MDCSGTGQVAQTGQSWRATPPIGKTESHPPRDVGPGSWRSCPDRARRRAKKSGATQGSQEITLDGHPRLAPDRGASHQHQGDRGAQIVLMEAEGLAQQPAGARPLDRLAHLAPGHHTQLRGRPARQADPVRDETSAHNATPALADIGKLTGAAKARLARQGQGRWSLDSHSKKTVGRRQTRRRGRNLARRGRASAQADARHGFPHPSPERAAQTGVNRLRPTRRRRARIARPRLLALRARKPCWRFRRIFDGWYWRFMQMRSLCRTPARTANPVAIAVCAGYVPSQRGATIPANRVASSACAVPPAVPVHLTVVGIL